MQRSNASTPRCQADGSALQQPHQHQTPGRWQTSGMLVTLPCLLVGLLLSQVHTVDEWVSMLLLQLVVIASTADQPIWYIRAGWALLVALVRHYLPLSYIYVKVLLPCPDCPSHTHRGDMLPCQLCSKALVLLLYFLCQAPSRHLLRKTVIAPLLLMMCNITCGWCCGMQLLRAAAASLLHMLVSSCSPLLLARIHQHRPAAPPPQPPITESDKPEAAATAQQAAAGCVSVEPAAQEACPGSPSSGTCKGATFEDSSAAGQVASSRRRLTGRYQAKTRMRLISMKVHDHAAYSNRSAITAAVNAAVAPSLLERQVSAIHTVAIPGCLQLLLWAPLTPPHLSDPAQPLLSDTLLLLVRALTNQQQCY